MVQTQEPKKEKFIKLTFDGDLIRIQKKNVSNIEYIGALSQLLASAQIQRQEWAKEVWQKEKGLKETEWKATWKPTSKWKKGADSIHFKTFDITLAPKKKGVKKNIAKKKAVKSKPTKRVKK